MTNNERTALQAFINKKQDIDKESDKIWKEICDEVRYTGQNPSCSLEYNIKVLREHHRELKADQLIEDYCRLAGQKELMNKLGQTLAELDFWK